MALEGIDFIREKVRARDGYRCQECGKQYERCCEQNKHDAEHY